MSDNGIARVSLHDQIAEVLRKEILSKTTNGESRRLEPEAVLAKRFSVSIVTLRNALLRLELEGLIERTPGRGTYIKDTAPKHKPKPKHVAIATGLDVFKPRVSYYYLGLVQQLRHVFAQRSIRTSLYVRPSFSVQDGPFGNIAELLEAVEEDSVCAVAVIGFLTNADMNAIFIKHQIPVVGENEHFPFSVDSNWKDIGRDGAHYLIENGRRKLAFIGRFDHERGKESYPTMPGGFRTELEKHGIPVHEEWLRCDLTDESDAAGSRQFHELWKSRDEKPDGLVVADDMLFEDAAMAIQELRINVPKELMVAAHNNKGSRMRIPFPAALIQFDPAAQAKAMAEIILNLLDGKQVAQPHAWLQHVLIPPGQ
jgi:DNA-binding LacI/PurR family transcriptional regulator/DNA-binding transcriptional regulator YhcF (GntR family)